MPEEGIPDVGHENVLRYEELETIVGAATELGIKKFRLTGGEPLVRKGIVDFVRRLKEISGVEQLTMTTNGALLGDLALPLKRAGLDRVNISLDSLRHSRFREITRLGNLDDVYAGINAATEAGLTPIKLNVVVMKGMNDDEIIDFVQLTMQHPFEVRFIELMPFSGNESISGRYISREEMLEKLPALRPLTVPLEESGVAELYTYPGARGQIGFISPLSHCFCSTCNKVRVTSDGKLKTCLHSNQEYDLKTALRIEEKKGMTRKDAVKKAIQEGVLAKEERHHLVPGQKSVDRNMNKIGG
jgi:cyclic pyranopterin phosphate synthase